MPTLTLAPFTTHDWGALFALLVAATAWRLRWLGAGGALAAFAVGTAVFGAGTVAYTLVLLAFFVTATVLGTRWGRAPRHPLTLRPLPAGISGAVTAAGSLGAVAGAALDTLLGATLQAQRRCGQCAELCETDPHRCGAQTGVVRGLWWLGNDGANFAATLGGALAAYLLVS